MLPAAGHISPPETFARDAIISWFRGEFAAANAIIDALCNHLTQINGGDRRSDYEPVFAAIHRRRLNWIPILQMQKYFSIADVAIELREVVAKKREEEEEERKIKMDEKEKENDNTETAADVISLEKETSGEEESKESDDLDVANHEEEENENLDGDSSKSKNNDGEGSQEGQFSSQNIQICSENEDLERRLDRIKTTKGFVAKEPVKGHMVNVVKGLKLYEDIFTDLELSKLANFINEVRLAGRKGELSGETFILFNKQLKGNKREIIQLGVPLFGPINDEAASNIEPIPSVLQAVIEYLVQCHLIPESRKPNSCSINFFDEGEYSQPYLKPPHLDQPFSTLFLSETAMAFGRVLVSDHHGNFKGPLMLSVKEGSLLVMRGNSADMARQVTCPSPNRRVSITFFRVRSPTTNQIHPSDIPPLTQAMTLWQPGQPQPYKVPSGTLSYGSTDMVPKWGVLRPPLVMLTQAPPLVMGPRRIPRGGTGVFLPWTMGSKKSTKHLPPRAQRGRLLSPPSNQVLS
ncbi:RNA demethylase ALKBH10B-like isoform X2 [Tasmannia lanceolata]|uniref:RNA demethylase ALKBH10B-like isoform X2 n=1 Tax=Tasmannia lanceolata TaxID=3420 RepID=UPI0040637FAF